MRNLIRKELAGWMTMADRHWEEHRPNMYRDLENAGKLAEALKEAADRTAREMDQLMDSGFTYHQAWEAVMESYLLLPEEDFEEDADESPDPFYELHCEMLELHRKICDFEGSSQQPAGREIRDHVQKKRAEAYRPNHSMSKKDKLRNQKIVAEFLDSIAKRSKRD